MVENYFGRTDLSETAEERKPGVSPNNQMEVAMSKNNGDGFEVEIIEGKLKLKYQILRVDEKPIDYEHVIIFEKRAFDLIFDEIKEGYITGEINDNICIQEKDPEDGIDYRCWWELAKNE